MARHVLEVTTSLGDTLLELAVLDRAMRIGGLSAVPTGDGFAVDDGGGEPVALRCGETVCLRRGRGVVVAKVVARPERALPRPPLDRRMTAFLAASLAAHLGLLVAAAHHTDDAPAAVGARRPRVITHLASAPRARAAATTVASVEDTDAAAGRMPPTAMAVSASGGDELPVPVTDASGDAAQTHRIARDVEPCAGGDCGLIASGPYQTRADAGDGYTLAPRQPHELDLSVVACTIDGGCSTTSGHDQQDIRSEISHHVGELHACFSRGSSSAASIELSIDDHGAVHASAHDGDPIGGCLAGVVGHLALPGGARDVTLAFARD